MIKNAGLPQQLQDAMTAPGRDRLLEHIRQAFRIERTQDTMRVTSIHQPHPLVEIRRTPAGHLLVTSSEGTDAWATGEDRILEGRTSDRNWWLTLQQRTLLIDQAILKWVREENTGRQAELHPDWGWHKQVIQMSLSAQDGISQDQAREQINQALHDLADPETLRRAAREKTPVDLDRYNIAAIGADAMRELRSRHPGALAWVMEHPRNIGQPSGPGDILNAFRMGMVRTGVPEEYTPDLAGLNRTFMRKICTMDHQTGAAGPILLGAMGQACRTWREEQPQDPGWLDHTATRLHRMLKRNGQNHWLTREDLVDALVNILEPGIHRAASAFQSRVGIAQYRLASVGEQEIRRLRRTNPGVITWAMANITPADTINHPGEIVSLVRTDLTQRGLEPRAWKTFSQTPAPLMRALARNWGRTRTAATFLNAMARSQARPAPGLIRNLEFLKIWDSMQKDAEIPLGLLFRESQRRLREDPENRDQRELVQEIHQAWDYCRAMNLRNRRVESRTFAGLMKRSREWHQQVTWEKLKDEWARTVEQQQGLHHAWNSRISTPMVFEDLTVVHLGSQHDLFIESRDMRHCIHSYTDRCLSGYSRIFSVSREGRKVATGEITREGNSWKPTQTRGVMNGEPPPEAHLVMDMVAIRYSRAWDQDPVHTSWMLSEPGLTPEVDSG